MTARVRDILGALDSIAPFRLALDWDNSGLQTGSLDAPVSAAAVALDPTLGALRAAAQGGAELLVSHHPLIFKPLRQIRTGAPEGAALAFCLKNDISVISAHTSWDASGMPQALAAFFEIEMEGFLEPAPDRYLKLAVFTPEEALERVSKSLFAAGCGVIGNYRGCSFYAPGFGTFVPGEGASPYSGSPGEPAKEPELRLEALVPAHLREKAQRAVKESHPYEEPAFDIYEAEGPIRYGFGLLGKWTPPRGPFAFVAEKIGRSDFLACGPVPEKVARVAVMPGSGGSYVQRAHELGAELLITGDVSHHQAVLARDLGMGVISAGHYELEAPGMEALAQSLRGALGPGVRVFGVGGESPFYSRPRAGG